MVSDFSLGEIPAHLERRDRAWRGAFSARLSLLAFDEERSCWIADLWHNALTGTAPSPLRDDAGQSAGGPRDGREGRTGHDDGGRLRAGDERPRTDRVRSKAEDVQTFAAVDGSELPDVANRHWGQALPPTAYAPGNGLRDRDGVFDATDALEDASHKALVRLDNLMDLDFDCFLDPKDVAKIGNVVHNAARTVLNTQVRVDEQRLRRKTADALPRILAAIDEEHARREGKLLDAQPLPTQSPDAQDNRAA